MSAVASQFLHGLAQALSALALYPEGHVSRERALDTVFGRLQDLLADHPRPVFSFLGGDEVVYNDLPLREMRTWDWSRRLAEIGIQRLQFDQTVVRDHVEEFLDMVLARMTMTGLDTSEARQTRPTGIRYGLIGVDGQDVLRSDASMATLRFSLEDEADAIRCMHGELMDGRALPLLEAEAVVRSLSVAMHGEQQIMVPLLRLRDFDEYTTTHSMNVSVLTMALAEWLGMGPRDVRAFGVAGLLHDLGKVKIPKDILNKSGRLAPEERLIMNSHPAEGAKMILLAERELDLAAVVAYEHHIMINGGGYPRFTYGRACHQASRLVHVCDVYDALRTNRPYRDAWPSDKILAYVEERSGVEFDGQIAHAFTRMIRDWEPGLAEKEDATMRTIQKTIGKTFSRCAQTYPNHDALIHTDVGVRYNYSLLLWEVERAAKGLIKMGIEKGDRVALWSPNIPEWVVGQLALAKVGAILVPIDPVAAPSDLRFALEQSESKAIIMARGVEDEEYVEMILDVRDQVRQLENIFLIGRESHPEMILWTELVALGEDVDISSLEEREEWIRPEDPVAIMYTSGTTGIPKGVLLDHLGLLNKSFASTKRQGLTPEDRLCLFFPLFHMFGNTCIALSGLLIGATVVMRECSNQFLPHRPGSLE